MGSVRHLYVHLPFCVHRCGYCDFVTAVGKRDEHAPYVEAVIRELERERQVLDDDLETVFVGGGTPTFTEPTALARLLAALPPAAELSIEANPETVTPDIAALVRDHGVTRISLGAQSFRPRALEVLERTASPDDVRRAVHTLRDAAIDNISLDLLYGIPGQEPSDLEADLTEALALRPEHLSCYELEAMPGTRFAHAWGGELARQAEALEGSFERVVERLTGAGYRWYETANFCLDGAPARGRDLRSHHNLGVWRGRDYLGVGVGAVSTLPRGEAIDPRPPGDAGASPGGGLRRRNAPSVGRYMAALARGEDPPREIELLDRRTRLAERLMLGLRLDEPLALADIGDAVDRAALDRLVERGLVETCLVERGDTARGEALRLTHRGRFLGGGVTADLVIL